MPTLWLGSCSSRQRLLLYMGTLVILQHHNRCQQSCSGTSPSESTVSTHIHWWPKRDLMAAGGKKHSHLTQAGMELLAMAVCRQSWQVWVPQASHRMGLLAGSMHTMHSCCMIASVDMSACAQIVFVLACAPPLCGCLPLWASKPTPV